MAEAAAPVIRALLFDIGRVIVRVDLNSALSSLGAGVGLTAEQVWAAIQADPFWCDWQRGRVAPHDWHLRMAQRFNLSLSFEAFCATWNSSLIRETILDPDLFAELASGYRLGLLSNTDPIHVAHMEAGFSFVRYFPVRVYSCSAGATKPDLAIYRGAIRELGVPPDQILYIDDSPEYVEAGREAGLQAFVFVGASELLATLRHRGILRA